MVATFTASTPTIINYNLQNPQNFNTCSSFSRQFIKTPLQIYSKGVKLSVNNGRIEAVNGGKIIETTSSWDEKPFEILPSGKKMYLDEQDVVTYLDPPKELIPLDPSTYNPASYLWKKISEIPEERRHRLLYLFNRSCAVAPCPTLYRNLENYENLMSAAWEAAGTRYDDAKLAEMNSSSLLSCKDDSLSLEFWNCHKFGGPMPIVLFNYLQKALFRRNGKMFGRLIGGSRLARIATSFKPLYFAVKEVHEVTATEHPCDLAYEFGDGFLDLQDYPEGFPKPDKHPWPFNDQIVIYIRHVGPGVMVGQAWQEGIAPEQVPKKLCGEILMVKDYSHLFN